MSGGSVRSKNSTKLSDLDAKLEDLIKDFKDLRKELNTLKFDLGYRRGNIESKRKMSEISM